MRRLLIIPFLLGLAGCGATAEIETLTGNSSSVASSVAVQDPTVIETAPSDVSLEHFSAMRLVGSGLTLREMSRNDAYTEYAADYFSNGLRISGIMNVPNGTGSFPLVMTNHGHIDPSIYTRGRGLRREQDFLARHGFAVFHSDYRGHGESDPSPVDDLGSYDAGIEYSMDVVNAIQAVRAANVPRVDTSRVGMLGHSMGGGISMNIAVAHPNAVHAIALYAPVHTDAWENFMRWRRERAEGDRTLREYGSRTDNPTRWDGLSSLTYLEDLKAPILLFHGTADKDVPKAWSDFLMEHLTALGKQITYVEYEGEGHEFGPNWTDFMNRNVAFFREHLQIANAATGVSIYDASRITKKPFGIHINRATSPVQPERFAGIHTGTDFEVLPNEDETTIAVSAICDGSILAARYVDGYGGVLVQSCDLAGEDVTVLYGHLALDSIEPSPGQPIAAGEMIGLLGAGFSQETDGERPHLHLSIHKGEAVELKGYVQNEADLQSWLDPVPFLP